MFLKIFLNPSSCSSHKQKITFLKKVLSCHLYYLVEIGKNKKNETSNESNILSKLTLLGPKYAAAIATTALILYLLFYYYMIILLFNKTGFWVFFLQLTPPPICPSSSIYFYSYFFVHFFATCCLFVISSKNRNMITINMIRGKKQSYIISFVHLQYWIIFIHLQWYDVIGDVNEAALRLK